jgi:hypothetical protein
VNATDLVFTPDAHCDLWAEYATDKGGFAYAKIVGWVNHAADGVYAATVDPDGGVHAVLRQDNFRRLVNGDFVRSLPKGEIWGPHRIATRGPASYIAQDAIRAAVLDELEDDNPRARPTEYMLTWLVADKLRVPQRDLGPVVAALLQDGDILRDEHGLLSLAGCA